MPPSAVGIDIVRAGILTCPAPDDGRVGAWVCQGNSAVPQLTVEGVGTFRVPQGKRLVNALTDECHLNQQHACGGVAACTTCKVVFVAGEPAAMRPAERAALESNGLAGQPGVRLSCQIACNADMTVRVHGRLHGPSRTETGPRPADVIEPAEEGPHAQRVGPEIETFRIVKWLTSPSDHGRMPEEPVESEEPLFRPMLRSAVPVLTVLDDGSLDVGEEIRIRKPSFVIGRSGGDLVLPNDSTISGRHAEIRLVQNRGVAQWTLHNLESINGTFVRVNHASFFADTIVIIGSRRYRLDATFQQSSDRQPGTLLVDQQMLDQGWPTLVDAAGRPESMRYLIRKPAIGIGGLFSGCDIEIDDPLVAKRHATLHRDPNGVWQLVALKTRNGVWANIHSIPLTSFCYFQCGEQRFRFAIP